MRVNILATIMFVAAVGCGDDAAETPDGGVPPIDMPVTPPDGTVDGLACTPTGGPGPVIVDGPSGDANLQVTVIVHDQAGAVVSRSAVLGPDASTTVDVPSCGMVSLFHIDPDEKGAGDVVTWANVQPGDHLVHVERRAPSVERIVNLTLPALAGATSYRVMVTCPGGGLSISFNPQPGPLELSPNCPAGATTVAALALARTATGASTALGTATIATSGATTVTLPAYTTAPTVTASVQGIGAFAGANATVQTQTFAAGSPLPVDFAQTTVAGATLNFPAVPAIAGAGIVNVTLSSQQRSANINSVVAQMPATVSVDLADLLPVPAATVDTAARPTVTWGIDRDFGAEPADLVSIELDYNADRAGVIEWVMLAPPVPGTIRFPEMPADLVPAGTATIDSSFLLSSTALAGYDDARNKLVDAFRNPPPPGNTLRTSSSRP